MKQLSAINKYFWKYRVRFSWGILFVIVSNYFGVLAPQMTGYVVDVVQQKLPGYHAKKHATPNDPLVDWLIREMGLSHFTFGGIVALCGIILLALALLRGLFMFLMRQTIIVMSRHIEFDQKNEIFMHYERLDTDFYKTHSTGDLMNRMSEDVSRVRMYTGPAMMYFFNLVALISLTVYYMVKMNLELTIYVLAPLPVLAITIYFVNTVIHKRSERIQELLSDLTTNAQQSYSGIRVIKSFVQEKTMLQYFRNNSEAYRANALGLAKVEAVYFPSMSLVVGISTLLAILIGGFQVHAGKANIGDIAAFVLYINMLTFPVSAIGSVASTIQRASASQKRLNEFLETEPVISNSQGAVPVSVEGDIRFEHVRFIYPHTRITALNDFDLHIRKGQKIAIIGRTGAGKSTVAQLLLRMYDPTEGVVKMDGKDIRDVDLHSLRRQISYVPQDVFLFSDTIRNNILFGNPVASKEDVQVAAEKAVVAREIAQLKEGYDTMIGERGVTLSGGQKQRLSIARGLIKEPKVIVFDDCLSAVDARTEREIIYNLYEFLQDKTAIIITHRIFSLFSFDQIVVLDNGQIVERGTHDFLLAAGGHYAELYAQQQKQEGQKSSI